MCTRVAVQPKKCPAYGRTCNNCKGTNHFAKMCCSKARSRDRHISQIDSTDDLKDVQALTSTRISQV